MRQLWVTLRMGDTTNWHNQRARMIWNIDSDQPPKFVVHNCTLCSDIPSWFKHAEYKHAISVQNPMSSLHRNSHDGWYWFVYPWRHQSSDHGRSGPTSCILIIILFNSRCICHENFPKMHR